MSTLRSVSWLLLVGALLVLTPGCGKKGPPVKPAPRLPASPKDFVARQRGAAVEFAASFPLVGLRGRSVRPPLKATLLYLVVPATANTSGWTRASRDREFLRSAQERVLGELDADRVGKTVSWSATLELADLAPAGKVILSVALRDRWGRSMPSRRVVLSPLRPALQAPQSFEAVAEAEAIRLRWQIADERATHVRIYRRVDGEGSAWEPWRVESAASGEMLDEGVSYGRDLVYAASASLADFGVAGASVESSLSPEISLRYTDVFPPRPPDAVDAVAIEQRVRILWNPGRSPDEALAVVERQVEGEQDWVEIGRVEAPETYFVDEEVGLGQRYRYRVIALDGAGNAGAPAGPTEWVEPRPPRDVRRGP